MDGRAAGGGRFRSPLLRREVVQSTPHYHVLHSRKVQKPAGTPAEILSAASRLFPQVVRMLHSLFASGPCCVTVTREIFNASFLLLQDHIYIYIVLLTHTDESCWNVSMQLLVIVVACVRL